MMSELKIAYTGSERFSVDAAKLRAWVAETEPVVPDGSWADESPAAHLSSLTDEARHAGALHAPRNMSPHVISVDELEDLGLVCCIKPTGSLVYASAGWTALKEYLPVEPITDDAERAVYLLERVAAVLNGILEQARGGAQATEQKRSRPREGAAMEDSTQSMTVGELIERLEPLDRDREVWMQGPLDDDPSTPVAAVADNATAVWPRADLEDKHRWERHPDMQESRKGVVLLYV